MEIIKYYETTAKEYWKSQIKQGDWSAAKLLGSLLEKDELKNLCGNSAEVYLLVEADNLVSFAVLAEQDEIDAPQFSPWIGFVYTFPQYRGNHNAGRLIKHICEKLRASGVKNVYISTEEIGLYEKYDFDFWQIMINREGKQTRVYRKDLLITKMDYSISDCKGKDNMVKKIKINFCDFNRKFKKDDNWIINLLKKHYDVELSEQPDFLFYSCFGPEYLNYNNCVKIFYTGENVIPNFNECDYASGFDYLDFEGRYFRRNYRLPDPSIRNRRELVFDDLYNRKFCNFIYSNANSGEGTILRQEFCKKLMEYKHVDCPGKVLNNMVAKDLEPRFGDWEASKIEFLKKYKFTIAFENSSSNGYTTEKLYQPLQSLSIPIYWGNPLVVRDFNPKAFINCNDYDNDFDAVIERVKELDNDQDKYLAMLRENPMQPDFDFNQYDKYEKWLVSIIEKGNKPFNKDPRNWETLPFKKAVNELKFYKKLFKGNFWCRYELKNGYVRKYVLGIRVSKRKFC